MKNKSERVNKCWKIRVSEETLRVDSSLNAPPKIYIILRSKPTDSLHYHS